MKYGNNATFWGMINKQAICIPRIQRDYVQGRNVKKIAQNRKSFLEDIFYALTKKTEIRLNFIYGYTDQKNAFIPIDGQQRLTTLFLLHLYLAAAEKGDLTKFSNFKYETRPSTERFLKAILEDGVMTSLVCCDNEETLKKSYEIIKEKFPDAHLPENYISNDFDDKINTIKNTLKTEEQKVFQKLIETFLKDKKRLNISERIKDSTWFVSAWNFDPTISSCLMMLDEIESQYKKIDNISCESLFSLLKSPDCPITFMVKDIESGFGKPNELYIKMNARGKQLTDYENLKSQLYEKIDDLYAYDVKNHSLPTDEIFWEEGYRETFEKVLKLFEIDIEVLDKIKDLKQKLDGEWYEYVWNVLKTEGEEYAPKSEKYTDILLKEIIHWVFINRIVLLYKNAATKLFKSNLSDILAIKTNDNTLSKSEIIAETTIKDYFDLLSNSVVCGFKQELDNEYRENNTSKDCKKFSKYLEGFEIPDNLREHLIYFGFSKILTDLYACFDVLHSFGDKKCHITNETLNQTLFGKNIKDNFSNALNTSHRARVNLFAISKYGTCLVVEESEFSEWYRTYQKLCENTIVDSPEHYRNACLSIEAHCDKRFDKELLEKLPFFEKHQRAEEIFKMIIKESSDDENDWVEVISKAENSPDFNADNYFSGNIYFAFRLLCDKLPDSLLNNNQEVNCQYIKEIDITSVKSQAKNFEEIWQKLLEIFNIAKREPKNNGWILHRTLLIHGDYSIWADSSRTFFFEGKKDYFTWRKLLNDIGVPFKVFRSLFEKLKNVDENNLLNVMQSMCKSPKFDNWMKTDNCEESETITKEHAKQLVKYPEILNEMEYKRFLYDSSKQRMIYYFAYNLSGKYCEAQTYYLYCMLNNDERFKGQNIKYHCGQNNFESETTECYIEIGDALIKYTDNKFCDNENNTDFAIGDIPIFKDGKITLN